MRTYVLQEYMYGSDVPQSMLVGRGSSTLALQSHCSLALRKMNSSDGDATDSKPFARPRMLCLPRMTGHVDLSRTGLALLSVECENTDHSPPNCIAPKGRERIRHTVGYRGIRARACRLFNTKRTNIAVVNADSEYLSMKLNTGTLMHEDLLTK